MAIKQIKDSAGTTHDISVKWENVEGKPTVGNGKITIKQAGTEKGSFTLNQSGNTTIELTDNNTDNDTKNTTGTTEKASTKLFLVGAESQASNPVTYSNIKCYIGTDNCLYSNGAKVSTNGHTHDDIYVKKSGDTMTGNLTLHADSGNSPYLKFNRGTSADNLCDWTIVDEGGYLRFKETINGTTTEILNMCGSGGKITTPLKITGTTFEGNVTGNCSGSSGSCTGNAATATTATNLAAKPSLAASGNNITVTAGGKTSGAFTVPYATSAGSAKNPNAIKLKNTSGTVVTYDGSSAADLSGGVYYATTAGSATKATNDGDGNTISSTYAKLNTDNNFIGTNTFNGITEFNGDIASNGDNEFSGNNHFIGTTVFTGGTVFDEYNNTFTRSVTTPILHLDTLDGEGFGGKIVFGDISGELDDHDNHYVCIEEIEGDSGDELAFTAKNFYFNGGAVIGLFDGNLYGNATTADYAATAGSATNDSDGNNILTTYVKNSVLDDFAAYADETYVTKSSSLKNPNAIKFKNTSGTVVTYDGSSAADLSGGVYYAATAGSAKNPNAIKLKNESGKVITYDGSSVADLSGGVYYAATAGRASSAASASSASSATTATNAYNVKINVSNTNDGLPILFTTWGTGAAANKAVYMDSTKSLLYNPNQNTVTCDGGFFETSDERLKDIVKPVTVDLDQLSKLRKVYFNWKDKPDSNLQLGMIAQDVQELYPELVIETNGQLSLSYDKLSVVALEAIDVLHNENNELKSRIERLESLVNKLAEK